ncbi:uncharacterized protein LOC125949104 isoform X2 [Anopheles darlingi]|uniref:uncharacterized protein LOC125949104 isoform X2 n=1 Tax=Anopheles darlingi TaxID=43151 RepID=UPI002100242B|nr:uncharacterized protein LOC125949104 isoform X2 [Anopheles darlingi]
MLERKPDYFIGSNGTPAMETRWNKSSTHRSPTISNKTYFAEMGMKNYKTVKCVSNMAIQNGRHIHSSISQAPSSSNPGNSSIITTDSRRWHNANVCDITSITSTKIKFATHRSPVLLKTPSPVLLRHRANKPLNHRSTSTSSSPMHRNTGNLLVPIPSKTGSEQRPVTVCARLKM